MSAKALIGGLVLGLALGAGGFYAVQTYVLEAPACSGRCGSGTVCVEDLCVAAEPEIDAPEAEPEEPTKKKRKGKRKKKQGTGTGADAEAGGPAIDDDSDVPGFDPNADRSIGERDGVGRLSDAQVDAELAKLDRPFQRCVQQASERVDELGTGKVSLSFGVDGKGKVTGVNVSAPANLKDAGIVPCVRKAIFAHKFPAYDGPETRVRSSFHVD